MSAELFSIFKLKDYYLDYNKSYKRLKEEYNRYKSIVVAYDFDDTVFDFHNKGRKYQDIIDLLKRLKENNCYLICFSGNKNFFIKDYLIRNNIPFDSINENPPFFKSQSRKIYYNALLDDRAGLLEVYNQLATLCNEIELEKEFNKQIKEYA